MFIKSDMWFLFCSAAMTAPLALVPVMMTTFISYVTMTHVTMTPMCSQIAVQL